MFHRTAFLLVALCVGTPAFGQGPQFAIDKKSCPPQGKTKGGAAISKTSDDGLRNQAKRHLPGGTQPVSLEIVDFKTLQDGTNQITGVDAAKTKTKFTVTTRLHLQQLKTGDGTVSEGDLVQVLSGKDRGKQGHVIKAQPSEGHVLVENDQLVAKPGSGQFIKRAKFGEELKPAALATA